VANGDAVSVTQEQIGHTLGNAGAVGTMLATLAGWLPPIAAAFSIFWLGIQIWESDTVRAWTGRKRPSA
jgi:hypothetical protein